MRTPTTLNLLYDEQRNAKVETQNTVYVVGLNDWKIRKRPSTELILLAGKSRSEANDVLQPRDRGEGPEVCFTSPGVQL